MDKANENQNGSRERTALYRIKLGAEGEKRVKALRKEFHSLGMETQVEIETDERTQESYYWLSARGVPNYSRKTPKVQLPRGLKAPNGRGNVSNISLKGVKGISLQPPMKTGGKHEGIIWKVESRRELGAELGCEQLKSPYTGEPTGDYSPYEVAMALHDKTFREKRKQLGWEK